jgi:hypothetical protein
MTDFRALCAELVDAIDSGIPTERIKQSPLAVRVDAALAQPEPQGPTDYELAQLLSDSNRQSIKDVCSTPEQAAALIRSHMGYARAALRRWGRPATTGEQQ